ncbi:flagellar hook-associated protein FlgL [Terrabacter aerolatus]|uniref:Flagellar hook-associated protein FlgL n=1 Tax=Terrabacter aerolatus TaxID=422442 RepID=A0A512CVS9_9MICO|nr:flagellar hook-associated protein FlgL [Terrabacter aerolatus]GEO28341.1 flagellar hook-associated protein FlgL [Terrabacter aerolatus]
MLRVTDQTMSLAAQRALAGRQSRLASAQETATSGTRIARPSDDPVGTGEALRVRADLAAQGQYQRNIADGTTWLSTLDSALDGATGLLRQVRDAVVQGGNGSLNQSARDGLASVVDGLRKDLLATANTRLLGRNVFAGTSDAEAAFTDGTPPTFNGAAGAVDRRVAPDQTVRVDVDGTAAFGNGSTSVFALLDGIAADLRAGTDPTARLAALDSAMSGVVATRSDVGSRLAELTRAGQSATTTTTSLTARRSAIEDVDLGQAVLDLQLQQTAYQAALAVTAKVIQPSLTEFLR